ncbi:MULTISPECIES: hypothetical protein [unclassified Nocardioides]|uniref:hypothetical protein n=1 Tax=unclassified Nocardioides TaxID=2615069 RepID=UPI0006F59B39|nr:MULTISPECIES: hypothetical protein [unclassified Nocardioides]KQY57276.1 hypothetical protein ASD30_13670 [Nocardioides sp. Root140]KQZ68789.1 hypothetical protein ASD66_16110 [Nocardioides sp. Root151]KRF11919.1 hypothetical protein ASH02_18345 [Nocardioides sp. Soil796]
MSKMDDLRKMREARYEAAAARAKQSAAGKAAARPAVAPNAAPERAAVKKVESPADEPVATEAPQEEALCGHRNMSGRTCTREQGHSAKSHRYS